MTETWDVRCCDRCGCAYESDETHDCDAPSHREAYGLVAIAAAIALIGAVGVLG